MKLEKLLHSTRNSQWSEEDTITESESSLGVHREGGEYWHGISRKGKQDVRKANNPISKRASEGERYLQSDKVHRPISIWEHL